MAEIISTKLAALWNSLCTRPEIGCTCGIVQWSAELVSSLGSRTQSAYITLRWALPATREEEIYLIWLQQHCLLCITPNCKNIGQLRKQKVIFELAANTVVCLLISETELHASQVVIVGFKTVRHYYSKARYLLGTRITAYYFLRYSWYADWPDYERADLAQGRPTRLKTALFPALKRYPITHGACLSQNELKNLGRWNTDSKLYI